MPAVQEHDQRPIQREQFLTERGVGTAAGEQEIEGQSGREGEGLGGPSQVQRSEERDH